MRCSTAACSTRFGTTCGAAATVTPAARAAGVTVAAAPQVVPKRVEQAAVEHLTVSFRVTDTRERLRLLKQFLVSNGYQYE